MRKYTFVFALLLGSTLSQFALADDKSEWIGEKSNIKIKSDIDMPRLFNAGKFGKSLENKDSDCDIGMRHTTNNDVLGINRETPFSVSIANISRYVSGKEGREPACKVSLRIELEHDSGRTLWISCHSNANSPSYCSKSADDIARQFQPLLRTYFDFSPRKWQPFTSENSVSKEVLSSIPTDAGAT